MNHHLFALTTLLVIRIDSKLSLLYELRERKKITIVTPRSPALRERSIRPHIIIIIIFAP